MPSWFKLYGAVGGKSVDVDTVKLWWSLSQMSHSSVPWQPPEEVSFEAGNLFCDPTVFPLPC